METKLMLRQIVVTALVAGALTGTLASTDQTETGLSINAPRILVADVPASFRFYHGQLGLKCVYGNEKQNFVELATGNETIQIFKRDQMPQTTWTKSVHADPVVLVFTAENVDKAYCSLLARGVKFAQKPTDMPTWQSRIALMRDPDGNLLEINGPLSTAKKS